MRPQRFSLLALLFVLSVFVSKPVFAQIDQDTLPFKHLEVGPFFTAGLSIFQGDVPDGAKTDVHFAFSGGALAMYSFHPHWGFGLAMGYESRGMYFHEQANDTVNETIGLNYLSIRPSIKFKQFLLGVNIGIPLSASTEYSHPNLSLVYPPITKDIMNTILDIRAEGLLPIVENDNGGLFFMINASYCLSDAVTKFFPVAQNFTASTTPVTKSPVPTLQIGLSYMLAPGGKHH